MRRHQRRSYLDRNLKRVINFQRGAQALAQRLTLDEFSSDEPIAVGFADLVDGENVRMVKSGNSARLLLKAAQTLTVFGESA